MTSRTRIASSLTFLLLASGLQAQVCSPITTVGRYFFKCDGYLTPAPNSALAPARILGTVSADETGMFRGTGTASIGGQIVLQAVTGTEKLNKDCTGTITYTQTLGGQPGPPLDITFVVSQQGNRIDGLITDPGAVLSCVLRRVSNDAPSAASASAAEKMDGDILASLHRASPKPQPAAVRTAK